MIPVIRLIGLALGLATAAALAAGSDLRAPGSAPAQIAAPPISHVEPTDPTPDAFDLRMVDSLPPQQRAERTLELAINGSSGAAGYVMHQAQSWRGAIAADDRLAAITLVAMNSPLPEVRMAGFEVQLAQDNLAKTPQEVDHLIARLHEDPQGVGGWMLYHLGLLGARGVERARVFDVLVANSRSDSEELRRWAVVSLGLYGGPETIDPLLSVASHDRSESIRESAFCLLAQSATLDIAERREAVSGLLAIAGDPRSDRQNVDWSYQALREITGIHDLPQEPQLWSARLHGIGMSTDRSHPP